MIVRVPRRDGPCWVLGAETRELFAGSDPTSPSNREFVMPQPITDIAQLHAALAPEVAAQIRASNPTLDPETVQEIVQFILKYGPSIWQALINVFHVTPKS